MIEALFIVLFQAAAGEPQPPQAAPTTQAETSQPAAEESQPTRRARRCENRNRANSRLGGRVCMTPEEFEAETERAREWFGGAQRSGSVNNPAPGGG